MNSSPSASVDSTSQILRLAKLLATPHKNRAAPRVTASHQRCTGWEDQEQVVNPGRGAMKHWPRESVHGQSLHMYTSTAQKALSTKTRTSRAAITSASGQTRTRFKLSFDTLTRTSNDENARQADNVLGPRHWTTATVLQTADIYQMRLSSRRSPWCSRPRHALRNWSRALRWRLRLLTTSEPGLTSGALSM